MTQWNSLVGRSLGQYQIVELIGEGGMAAVYKAWQPTLRRYVALKVLTPDLAGDAEFVKRFHQEAVAAANLKQTNIVTIHDVGVEGDHHYIAMELIEGTSLAERVRSGPPLTPEQVVDIITQVGAALDYAHERGFVHRDVKPANILVDASGRVVLTDFGLVKALSGSGVTSTLTRAGTVFGTPRYMSPEQIKDEPLDYRSDLYSLGIVCYEMLSGQVPFDSTTTHSVLYAQVNTPPPPLRDMAGLAVPPPVEAVVERMLAKARENRYQSAGQFARDLAQAVAGVWPARLGGGRATLPEMESDTASIGGTPEEMPAATVRQPAQPPTPPVSAPVRRRSRWPLLAGVAAAVGILLIVGTVVGVLVLGKWYTRRGAQAALASGDYVAAAQRFSQILESDPSSTEAVEGLSEAAAGLARAGQFDDAILAYEAVWQASPSDVLALRGLGQAYEAQGEWGKAAGWYERWTQAQPEDRNAFLALGRVRYRLGEYERAVAAYERAEVLGADPAEMGVNAGLAYFELSQYDRAVEYLQDEISQNVESFEAQRALGVSLFAQGQPGQAVVHLNAAVTLGASRSDDELTDVYYALSGSFFAEQDYEQAIRLYERAREVDPDGKAVWAHEARANLDEVYSRLAQSALEDALLDLDFSNIVAVGGETYAIAQGGQEARVEGPLRLVDGLWEGSQALVVEESGTIVNHNPLLNGQYRGGLAPACFLGGDALSILPSESALYTQSGGKSQRLVFAGSTGSTPYFGQDGGYSPSTQYSVRIRLYVESLTTSVRVRIYDGSSPLDTDLTTVGWHEITSTFTSPATISNERILVYSPANDAATVYVDVMVVESKPYVTSPFDGDSGDGYSWGPNGPHADASTRQATRCEIDAAGSLDYASDHTVLVWMKLSHGSGAGPVYPAVFHYGQYYTDNSISLMFYRDGEALQLYARDNAGLWQQRGAMNNPVQDTDDYEADTWYVLGYRYDEEDNRVDLIWDGQISEQDLGTAWPSEDNTYHRLGIGCRPNGDANWSDGAVAMVAVFPRTLTDVEVAALHRAGLPAGR
jgi:tetratricopeptide (TPR) repeat protein